MLSDHLGGLVGRALVEPLDAGDVEQAALRFSPFRDGRGLSPRGLVHGLRRAAYPASQTLRPAHDGGAS